MSTLEEREPTAPSRIIEVFDNPHPNHTYLVESVTDEFTCLCPLTAQPDFATIRVRYVPGEKCFELKSFKLYLWSFRDEGHFHEDLTNQIMADLRDVLNPIWLEVCGGFNVRGGIETTVTARCGEKPKDLD